MSLDLTPSQRDQLIALVDECRALGATPRQLAPLYGALDMSGEDWDALSEFAYRPALD